MFSAPEPPTGNETRYALDVQRKALMEAVARRDAAAVAKLYTTDANLMLPGIETITGREAIQKFWQAVLGGGFVKGIDLVPGDAMGKDGDLLAETGAITTLDGNGKQMSQSRYLIVWQREEAGWRIRCDMVNPEFAEAPIADRVGFPKDYRTNFNVLGVSAMTNTRPPTIVTIYGNGLVTSVTNAAQPPYANGSIFVAEFADSLQDSEGRPLLDAEGQSRKGKVQHVDVMRRGDGFGEAYASNRSGEWEFAGYNLNGTYSTTPTKSASCAQCHQKAGQAKDFVFPFKSSAQMAK